MQPLVTSFFDEATFTFSYIVKDPSSANCAIIDSVLGFDYASGRTDCVAADKLLNHIHAHNLDVQWILETHVHADHLSAAPYLKEQTGAKIGIGARVSQVQDVFSKAFNFEGALTSSQQYFDQLFDDKDVIKIGNLVGNALHTPGHTPACMTYLFGDAAFIGDTLFMPDYGTARCDFPGGDAAQLYQSIQTILSLADNTRLFMCHDYKAPGRDVFKNESSVKIEREQNVHLGPDMSQENFVKMRQSRDAQLNMPKLIIPSVQVNIRAGYLPEPEDNGQRYLKIPIDKF